MDEANLVRGPNYGQKQLGSREANSTLTPGGRMHPSQHLGQPERLWGIQHSCVCDSDSVVNTSCCKLILQECTTPWKATL